MVHSRSRSGPPRERRGGKPWYMRRRKVCSFCVDKVTYIDYKDPPKLKRFISDRGKIEPRRKTGTCAKHQRGLTTALKRARNIALIPIAPTHIMDTGPIIVME